jgi:hypothetical protein
MIRLATILHRTPSKIHRNSQNCRAKVLSSTMNADASGAFFLVKGVSVDPTTTKHQYRVLAKIYVDRKTGKPPNNPSVFIWCGCSWFKFNCEVALSIRGSSYIVNSNGALPKITNPSAKPQVCKHALAFFRVIRASPMKLEMKAKQASVKKVVANAQLDDKLNARRGSNMKMSDNVRNSTFKDALGDVKTKLI